MEIFDHYVHSKTALEFCYKLEFALNFVILSSKAIVFFYFVQRNIILKYVVFSVTYISLNCIPMYIALMPCEFMRVSFPRVEFVDFESIPYP